ncbi:MAG: hypothetical protein HYZ18_11580 [Pseudogulbenkiania sp.]|nr:hypothetical protein [Pseudogulbenkiania sp.]
MLAHSLHAVSKLAKANQELKTVYLVNLNLGAVQVANIRQPVTVTVFEAFSANGFRTPRAHGGNVSNAWFFRACRPVVQLFPTISLPWAVAVPWLLVILRQAS